MQRFFSGVTSAVGHTRVRRFTHHRLPRPHSSPRFAPSTGLRICHLTLSPFALLPSGSAGVVGLCVGLVYTLLVRTFAHAPRLIRLYVGSQAHLCHRYLPDGFGCCCCCVSNAVYAPFVLHGLRGTSLPRSPGSASTSSLLAAAACSWRCLRGSTAPFSSLAAYPV